jgi:hypothetical protein
MAQLRPRADGLDLLEQRPRQGGSDPPPAPFHHLQAEDAEGAAYPGSCVVNACDLMILPHPALLSLLAVHFGQRSLVAKDAIHHVDHVMSAAPGDIQRPLLDALLGA